MNCLPACITEQERMRLEAERKKAEMARLEAERKVGHARVAWYPPVLICMACRSAPGSPCASVLRS